MTARPLLVPFDLGAALAATTPGSPGPALARVATRFGRSFAVISPFAPGLCCIGADVMLDPDAVAIEGARRISATGNGTAPQKALSSCLGEAADLVSQYERPGDVAARGTAFSFDAAVRDGWIAQVLGDGIGGQLDGVGAVEAHSRAVSLLPADLCLRRAPGRCSVEPVGPLSAGVAAGPTHEAAALRAVLELCERDALALWWLGGRPARRFADHHPATLCGRAMIDRLRSGVPGRATRLLDLGGDLGPAVVAAVSLDGSGRGFACGAAARLDPGEAAEAAVLELCQMELAAPLAGAKLAQGGAGVLNDADRRHLQREAWDPYGCALLDPDPPSDLTGAGPPPDTLANLVRRLSDDGIVVHLVDLTRPDVGVPVVRAVAPRLQPYATSVTTQRLEAVRASAGRSPVRGDVPLF